MKKRIKQKKGFAMAELLAVSGVIMLLFSILFANYLPLMAEYERRIDYNNVTAEYAGHYLRKIYKLAIDNDSTLRTALNNEISTNNYSVLYQEELGEDGTSTPTINKLCGDLLGGNSRYQDKCQKIIEYYGVTEVALTKYTLNDAKTSYQVSTGSLYDYIQYLPKYTASIYNTSANSSQKELYRFIIKTNDFGYATTPIDSNYLTPNDCFIGTYNDGKLTITGYDFEKCPTTIVIPTDKVKIKLNGGTGFTPEGIIYSIGANAFKKSPANQIIVLYGNNLKEVNDSAFEETNLTRFSTEGESGGFFANNITKIGANAFKNTKLSEITLKGTGVSYGNGAFSNNKNLEKINIEGGDTSLGTAESLFANSGNDQNIDNDKYTGIVINYGGYLETINKNTFSNTKLNYNSLKFYKTIDSANFVNNLKNIGEAAYKGATVITTSNSSGVINENELLPGEDENGDAISEDELENGSGNSGNEPGDDEDEPDEPEIPQTPEVIKKQVLIPVSVKTIGQSAFQQIALDTISFATNDNAKANIESIGTAAFANTKSDEEKDLTIPDTTNTVTIMGSAFLDSKIKELSFVSDDSSKIVLSGGGSYHFGSNSLKSVVLNNRFCSATAGRALNIGAQIFKDNTHGIALTLPNCNATIPNYAFQASNITGELTIPKEITRIGSLSFAGNETLQSVVIPSDSELTRIGDNAFLNDSGLMSFIVSKKVTSIGADTFAGCNKLALPTTPITDYSATTGNVWCETVYAGNNCSIEEQDNNIIKIRYKNELNRFQDKYIKKMTEEGE